MDLNKLAELRRIGYKIPKTCRFCKHSRFAIASEWGTCDVHTYEHLKHTDAVRQLSIYKDGACSDKFEMTEQAADLLGAWHEFLA